MVYGSGGGFWAYGGGYGGNYGSKSVRRESLTSNVHNHSRDCELCVLHAAFTTRRLTCVHKRWICPPPARVNITAA